MLLMLLMMKNVNFLRSHIFYFCLNPGSKDTGGLLGEDWTTPNLAKLRLLSNVPSTNVLALVIREAPLPPITSPPGG